MAQAQLDAGTQSVSEKSLQAARLGISKAQAELAERRRKLADTRVVAPIGGTIHIISRTRSSSMSASGPSSEVLGPGVRVFEGDPFLEIATTERACVRIDVDETDIGRITRGTPATITGDAFPGVRLKGEVTEIQTSGKKAGQGVSLFPVTVLITSPLRGVHMGMTADVGLALGAREARGATMTPRGDRGGRLGVVWDVLAEAWWELKRSRLRSYLALLGIAAGAMGLTVLVCALHLEESLRGEQDVTEVDIACPGWRSTTAVVFPRRSHLDALRTHSRGRGGPPAGVPGDRAGHVSGASSWSM